MSNRNNQYPENSPDRHGERNRTGTIVTSILAVLLLIVVVIIAGFFLSQDSDDITTPVETVTVDSPEPVTITTTTTASADRTTQTITREPTATPPSTSGNNGDDSTTACDPVVFQEDGHDFVDVLMFCEANWARGGLDQTDYVRIFRWVDNSWQMYAPSGESMVTGYPCYDTRAMAAAGAPAELINQTSDCSQG